MKKVLLSVAVVALMGLSSCGGASLCECANMDEEKMTEECKELGKEMEEKYKNASDEEKKKMETEMEACEEGKEGEQNGGASLCDCVNMEQDKLTDECKEMQKEFKAKYKEASDEEKESMRKDTDACKGEKEEKEEEGEH